MKALGFAAVSVIVGATAWAGCGGGGGGGSAGGGAGTQGSTTTTCTTGTCKPVTGTLGATCTTNGDCTSSVCMQNGHCTAACSAATDCPASPNWTCSPLSGHGTQCQCTVTGAEVCDGTDNDCDGLIDNGATCKQTGYTCHQATCTCDPANFCGATCVDKATDVNNCGACGTKCPANRACVAGACGCPGVKGQECGGACKDVDSDPESCGACGTKCTGNTSCKAGTCVAGPPAPPSCKGGLDCGGVSCCETQLVPGGTFPMGRSVGGTDACPAGPQCSSVEQPEHPVTVADFYLDTFEVTVGRFRKFVAAFNGTPPAVGAGAHPLIANSGWQAGWNASLAASQAALISNLNCSAQYQQTWTDAPGANETYAINCVSWYEATAFCAWDGGRMPTEAEWEYASAGGSDNRLYPWGATDPSVTKTLANDAYSDQSPFIAVGSHPSGNGKWGHRDLAGGMWEWNLDWYDENWYSGAGQACSNCANLNQSSYRVFRGGSWDTYANYLRAALRNYFTPADRFNLIGLRCSRSVP